MSFKKIDEPLYTQDTSSFSEKRSQAQELEAMGQKEEAARLYGEAGYLASAYRLYEEIGDGVSAYTLAIRRNDYFSADRLAYAYKIPHHEFSGFINTGKGFMDSARVVLESRLQHGAIAERELGFKGFEGKIVADIGTRDGRFIPVFRNFGAKEVYGIDPDQEGIDALVKEHILDQAHAIPTTLQEIPPELKGKIEVGAVFNFNMPRREVEGFFKAAHEALSPHGVLLITVAEGDILAQILPSARKYFSVKSTQLFYHTGGYPHKHLVFCEKIG